jgi:hypothetical protein
MRTCLPGQPGITSFEASVTALLDELQEITKEAVGIHVLLIRSLFGDDIPRSCFCALL